MRVMRVNHGKVVVRTLNNELKLINNLHKAKGSCKFSWQFSVSSLQQAAPFTLSLYCPSLKTSSKRFFVLNNPTITITWSFTALSRIRLRLTLRFTSPHSSIFSSPVYCSVISKQTTNKAPTYKNAGRHVHFPSEVSTLGLCDMQKTESPQNRRITTEKVFSQLSIKLQSQQLSQLKLEMEVWQCISKVIKAVGRAKPKLKKATRGWKRKHVAVNDKTVQQQMWSLVWGIQWAWHIFRHAGWAIINHWENKSWKNPP